MIVHDWMWENIVWPVLSIFVYIRDWIWVNLLEPIWDFLVNMVSWFLALLYVPATLFWQIYWMVYLFMIELFWFLIELVIQIVLYLPSLFVWLMGIVINFILVVYGMIAQFIMEPIDGICVSLYTWLDDIADSILEVIVLPEWESSVFEIEVTSPIIGFNAMHEILDEYFVVE